MLNLHNILLISPPQNHPPPPPSSISSDHPNIHNQNYNTTNNDNSNNNGSNNNNNLHGTSFWGLKKWQESSKDAEDDGYARACKDCGNRAKKECSFRRCRTCCKTRGYACATHVRSTWLPAAKRREKVLMTAVSNGDGGGSSGSSSCGGGVKRPRVFLSAQNVNANVNAATSSSACINAAASLSFSTGPCQQDESFKKSLPGKVQAPAVFRCVRVTAVSDDEAEIGYVATVNISGHVFKGYLCDQGTDEKILFPCISKMQMETDSTGRNRDSSSPIVDPSNAYAASRN